MNINEFILEGKLTSDDIVKGMVDEDFFLVYQPIVLLETLETVGYEALARWNFEGSGKFISPVVFMGFGELKIMRQLTRYLVSIAERDQKLLDVPISFNYTNFDIYQGVDTTLDNIEITEEHFTKECIPYINNISKDKKLILDDLGQGYSAWPWIPYLNLYKIKYDKILVDNLLLQHSEWYYDLLKATTTIAKKYNLIATAEGIETKEQLELLRDIGVEEGQGWLFSKPYPVERWIAQ